MNKEDSLLDSYIHFAILVNDLFEGDSVSMFNVELMCIFTVVHIMHTVFLLYHISSA